MIQLPHAGTIHAGRYNMHACDLQWTYSYTALLIMRKDPVRQQFACTVQYIDRLCNPLCGAFSMLYPDKAVSLCFSPISTGNLNTFLFWVSTCILFCYSAVIAYTWVVCQACLPLWQMVQQGGVDEQYL